MFYPDAKVRQALFKEGASQTFKVGDLVALSGGYVVAAGADPATVLGIAQDNAHNSATAGAYQVSVAIADPTATFIANVTGTAPANKTDATDIGKLYGVVSSGGQWYVDKDETVNTRVVVVGLVDPAGTVNGRVLVRFKTANTYFA